MNQNKISGRMARRSVVILALFLVFALVIIGTLFDLQILNYEKYQNSVLEQITIETRVNAERGAIYDRNGKTLATNATVWLVFISPQDILDAMADEDAEIYTVAGADGTEAVLPMNELIARRLSEILEVDYDTILKKAAKAGFTALSFDPIDQGERFQGRHFGSMRFPAGTVSERCSISLRSGT